MMDIYVRDSPGSSTLKHLTDLMNMHRANHRTPLWPLKDYIGLLTLTDAGRQQPRTYLRSLIVRWAAFELDRYDRDNTKPFPLNYA